MTNSNEHWVQIRAIEELKARYCRLLDTKQWEAWSNLFLADATMDVSEDVSPEVGTPIIRGRELITRQTSGIIGSARTAHQVHSPEITLQSSEAASGIWAMQDIVSWQAGSGPIPAVKLVQGFGHYHETYTRKDGRWWIASLKLTRLYVSMS
jgi:hypothetical protein